MTNNIIGNTTSIGKKPYTHTKENVIIILVMDYGIKQRMVKFLLPPAKC